MNNNNNNIQQIYKIINLSNKDQNFIKNNVINKKINYSRILEIQNLKIQKLMI